ncbi:sugar phosphate isomerase/epimerase [Sedimentibacter sp. zth1]|uniref:sugar phosphate isomerase/epimerase family protein n=1 Tax=Sedimentibacter sp. zth1 TaxID=2816908 RepID=UPI001A915962|nr:sugar phosphate isomerase/epimerase [Sedimentibacter sp. zth1]QSX05576.1 sugar phosphate isomerase/epimerase [Sedimentibacter sp. zth1]
MYKTGIFNWFGYILPIQERLELIKEANFDSVMLWWEDETIPYFVDKMNFISLANSIGLAVDNVHLPFEDTNLLWSDKKNERNKKLTTVLTWLCDCKKSNVQKVVMHTNDLENISLNYKMGFESFNEIVKLAEDIDLNVAIENTKHFEYSKFILDEFKSPKLGFCYDSSHDFVNGQSKGLILNQYKNRLMCVHLSDNDGLKDRHWLPTKGSIDFKNIINIIKETSVESFSMEVYPYLNEKSLSPIEFLNKANNIIKKIIS